jgi:hypothetical protein
MLNFKFAFGLQSTQIIQIVTPQCLKSLLLDFIVSIEFKIKGVLGLYLSRDLATMIGVIWWCFGLIDCFIELSHGLA